MTRSNLRIAKCLIFVIIFQVFSSCKDKEQAFNGEVYSLTNKNYGYAIYFKQKLIIKQETVPALSGDVAFKDSLQALRVMDLVIKKLNEGKSPTINTTELKELKIKM